MGVDATPPSDSFARAFRSTLGGPGRSRPRRPTRVLVLLAMSAVAVAMLLVAAQLLTTVAPPTPPSSPTPTLPAPPTGLPYSGALPLAEIASEKVSGGPWTLFSALGVELRTAEPFGAGLTCNFGTGVPGSLHFLTTSRPGIPSFSGSRASGDAPWWLFQYENGTSIVLGSGISETSVLDVVVVNGSATPLLTASTLCDQGLFPAIPFAGVVNSSAVAPTAVASNASFVDSHPGINVTLSLMVATGVGPQWTLAFTTCPAFGQSAEPGLPSTSGWKYLVSFDGSTGLQTGSALPAIVSCSATG